MSAHRQRETTGHGKPLEEEEGEEGDDDAGGEMEVVEELAATFFIHR